MANTRVYKHLEIEENWRSKWYDDNIYEAHDFSPKPKKYILAELPYPSGKYLHAGHMMRYTIPEVYSRLLRMQGYNVLFPMGWDSFGLPAETFAIKSKSTPQQVIAQAEHDYKNAMQLMGYAIDWKREINTSKPEFYKWTQWMFLKLWERGLVTQKEMPVWWCKELGVLADEEVLTDEKGQRISERGSYPVSRKNFKQWVLRITDYAQRLLDDLDKTQYMDYVKQGQINWIGKKEGTMVTFKTSTSVDLPVFTTRIDTIFGVSYLALCPEHPSLASLLETISNRISVEKYINQATGLSEIERQTKDKTGVVLEGVHAIHPLTGKEIPMYVADYVLSDFGTGVVMGVPAHDVRDNSFAKKHNLPIIQVLKSEDQEIFVGESELLNSGDYTGKTSEEARSELNSYLKEKGLGGPKITYKLRDTIWSRQRYWGEPIPLIYTTDGKVEADYDLPITLPELGDDSKPISEFPPLSEFEGWANTLDSQGRPATRECDVMPTWAGSNWYYIRYLDPTNDSEFCAMDKMKYWLPVDKYYGDAGHTTAHLLYTRFWYKALFDMGYVPSDEPISFRMSGGILLGEDRTKMSKSRPEFTVDPKYLMDSYGADAARMVLCFLGPYDATYPWNPQSIKACYKVISTIYELTDRVVDKDPSLELLQAFHKLIKNSTKMLEDLKMNSAVSEIMIFVNFCKTQKELSSDIWKEFSKIIAPITPFVAEQIWQELNEFDTWDKVNSVHVQPWPLYLEELTHDTRLSLPIQINGKLRAVLDVSRDASEDEIKDLVFALPEVKKYVSLETVKKFIYVKHKIVSISG